MKFNRLFVILFLFLCRIPVPAAELPVSNAVPRYDVRAYQLEGDTILPREQLTAALTNYTGKITLAGIHVALDYLQEVYRLNNLTNVYVVMPRQSITNGIVRVQVVPSRAAAVAVVRPPPALNITGYRIEGNTVLPPSYFCVLSNYTGTNLDFARLREGLGQVQLLYREFGYSTINVTLPQQRLTNGFVHVKIVEGRLADIRVTGNHWFSTANIRRALPGLTTNILLNNKWFQPELDLANANQDRQIYPVIGPGPDPGTTALELRVKDQLPLHGRFEINDKSSPASPLLRMAASLMYDNLWQLEHQFGVAYNFSPQAFKPNSETSHFYDEPLVASYSAFYRIPLGFDSSTREKVESQPANFGYDEITHQFNLPPPTGHPDLVLYASRSVSDTPVRYGPLSIIFTNTLAHISSQSAELNETMDDNIGAKLNIPIEEIGGIHSTFSFGADFKSYEAPSFYTNLTYFSLYAIDPQGNPVLVTNSVIRLPSNTRAQLEYIPLSYGWTAARPDPFGSFRFNFSESVFPAQLASARTNFQVVAGAPKAGGNYTTIDSGLMRTQKLPYGWTAVLNADGQWASAPLISNEQFALGGTSGVRGYQQGEIYGDDGWRTLFDLRAPPLNVGYFPTATGSLPAQLYLSGFFDYGRVYLIDRPVVGTLAFTESGSGVGAYLTVGSHFDASLTLAWALHSTPTTSAGDLQAYFTVGTQF